MPIAISYNELPHFPLNNTDVPIKVITQPPISLVAWNELFNEAENQWSYIFRILYLVTYETKIQSF